MRKPVLTLLLFAILFSCHAEEFAISLAGRKLSNPLTRYYIEDLFLSQREDSCLGYINPLGPNSYMPIFFEKNIRTELKEFLQYSMPRQVDLLPLLVRVNRIYMYETTKGVREYTCIDLSLSFIFPRENGLNDDFTSSVTLSVYQKNFPASFSVIVVNALDQCFCQYRDRMKMGLVVPKIITLGQLKGNPIYSSDYFRCFSRKNPRKGIYHTYFDFRDNVPDTSLDFKVLYKYDTDHPALSRAYLKFAKDSEPGKIWGFCEGDSVYLNWGRFFSLLSKEGDLFIASCRSTEYNRDIAPAAIFGGILGGLIGASLFGGIATLSFNHNEVGKFKMDLFDGKFFPFDAPDYTMISSNLVLFLSKVSDPEATLSVYLDGNLQCEMKPGTYFNLFLSCRYSTVNIKFVSSTGSEKSEQIPLELFKTEAYLVRIKRNHSIETAHRFDQVKTVLLRNRTKENTICSFSLVEGQINITGQD